MLKSHSQKVVELGSTSKSKACCPFVIPTFLVPSSNLHKALIWVPSSCDPPQTQVYICFKNDWWNWPGNSSMLSLITPQWIFKQVYTVSI